MQLNWQSYIRSREVEEAEASSSKEMKELIIQIAPAGASLLTILFVGLKLFGLIHWSWLWVFSPILLPMIMGFVWVFGVGGLLVFVAWLKYRQKK